MSYYEFVLLVQKMRRATKAYFRSRAKKDLATARGLEEEVDRHVKKFIEEDCDGMPIFSDN